jgi:hypothetical protein
MHLCMIIYIYMHVFRGLNARRLERRKDWVEVMTNSKRHIKGLLTPGELRKEKMDAKARMLDKQEATGDNMFGIV